MPLLQGLGKRQFVLDPSCVLRLYTEDKLSSIGIAAELGVSKPTILRLLRKYGVMRSLSEAQKLAVVEGRNKSIKVLLESQRTHPVPKGQDSHSWKGGRLQSKYGYIYIYCPDHPNANSLGYVAEHRLVMEQMLGRYLLISEKIHHISGIKDDNRRENLQLLSPADHNVRNQLCSQCGLRTEIRLLQWQIKELTKQLQGRFSE